MKNYTLHLREIRVVPVIIEAESLEEAKNLIFEGCGEYVTDKSYHSCLSFSDFSDNLFETAFENNEIAFSEINS